MTFDPDAAERAIAYTEGYPYFIQEIGSVVWNLAEGPRITLEDIDASLQPLEAKLDASFFSIRTAKTTELELAYLRAMAEPPRGPKSSGDIAAPSATKAATKWGPRGRS